MAHFYIMYKFYHIFAKIQVTAKHGGNTLKYERFIRKIREMGYINKVRQFENPSCLGGTSVCINKTRSVLR